MKENRQLRWAMPGTGVIANEMAQALQAMDRTLDAVGNRTYGKAVSFGSKYGGEQVCADYHQMFTDLDIDAICLTPPQHPHGLSGAGPLPGQACAVREVHPPEQRRAGPGHEAGGGTPRGAGRSQQIQHHHRRVGPAPGPGWDTAPSSSSPTPPGWGRSSARP